MRFRFPIPEDLAVIEGDPDAPPNCSTIDNLAVGRCGVTQSFRLFRAFAANHAAGATRSRRPMFSIGERLGRWPFGFAATLIVDVLFSPDRRNQSRYGLF